MQTLPSLCCLAMQAYVTAPITAAGARAATTNEESLLKTHWNQSEEPVLENHNESEALFHTFK